MTLNELKRLAKAATPGPWINNCNTVYDDGPFGGVTIAKAQTKRSREQDDNNAAFIAGSNPALILALVGIAEAAEIVTRRWRSDNRDWGHEYVNLDAAISTLNSLTKDKV